MYYNKRIQQITGCNEQQATEIEEIMREDILHSTLDWLSRSQFEKATKEALQIYKIIKP